jgi:hypothetical protein
MLEIKYSPVNHDHAAFLAKASQRNGFSRAYASLEPEYEAASQRLWAHTKAGLAPEAARTGTTKSVGFRLESEEKASELGDDP